MNVKSELYYTEIVQNYLNSVFESDSKVSENCITAVETYCHINSKRYFRIIALIKKQTSHAVVILSVSNSSNHNIGDIHVLDVLPVNMELNLDTDTTRTLNGDLHPAILTGEDFTLVDFDPLSCDKNLDSKDFGRKKFRLDFSSEDFNIFSTRLSNAYQFVTKDELYSSFDWLQRLKDEAKTVSDIRNDSPESELNNDVILYGFEDNGQNNLSDLESARNTMSTSDIFPTKQDFSISLVEAPSKVNDAITVPAKTYMKKNIPKSSNQLLVNNKSSDHHKSSPDLQNGSFDDPDSNSPLFFNSVNDNRQFAYIETKLRQKEAEYCQWENHSLFMGTWNVNGRIDDSIKLDDWLTPPKGSSYPNFYILGFQEIDLSIGSVALNRGSISNLEERWLKLIETSLPFKKNQYKRLYRSRLSGILMIVYVDKKFSKHVSPSHVSANKVPTGMFNVMGNKGAVGIRFRVFNSHLCFINCHLAAGESNRQRRDQDFREIEKNLTFFDEYGKEISIYEHDLVFLMGDLNYRILNIEAMNVKDLVYRNSIEKLLENDELLNGSKAVFQRFKEAKITFMPTYKFDPNSDEYDTSEKNRVPSFCDRIMWAGDRCQILNYSSHMSLKSSDHKPVSAMFTVGLKIINTEKRLKVQETIIRGMDFIYNLSLPQAKISRQEINFENIHFFEYRQASISFTNTGQFEFLYNFKEIPGCPKIPDWLTVRPSEGTVRTDETCELVFEIFINANNVSELNTKSEVQCILILTLLGGKDYFITVTAELVPTSFGLPLSLLVSLRDPVATFSRKELYERCVPYTECGTVSTKNTYGFSTAKEIYVMVDHLLNNIDEEELFARPGFHPEIQTVREQLDTNGINADLSTVSVHSVAEALLMFLNALYVPIVPASLMKECMDACYNLPASIKVISKLPTDHRNLFHYLTSFLRKVLDHRTQNGSDIRSLGILFVDLIFRPKKLTSTDRETCSQFIRQFIENDSTKYLNFTPEVFPD